MSAAGSLRLILFDNLGTTGEFNVNGEYGDDTHTGFLDG
jgi:hypothetical protein